MLTTRTAAFVMLTITLTPLVTGCGGARSRYESHMRRGQEYYAKSEFSKAGVEFRNAMQIQPKDAAARVMAGQSAEKLGRPRDALSLYQAVVDSDPDNLTARANLARLLDFAGQPDAALKVIEPGLGKHPDDAALLTLRALARMQHNDLPGATADVDRALLLAPSNEETIALRAGFYRQSGDLERAMTLVSDGVKRLPDSANLRLVLADLSMAAGRTDEAEAQLQALIARNPKELQYRSQLALFYSRTHKLDEAQQALEGAVNAAPENDQAKLNLATFVATQRTHAQAEKILRGFIAKAPKNDNLRLGLGSLLERFNATDDAAKVYAEVIQRDPKGQFALMARDRMAAIAVAQGHYDEAKRLLAEVLQASPRDNDALTLRAEMALARTESAAAIVDLRSVLRDQPSAAGVHRLLGRAYVANGQPALAEQSFRDALALKPADTSLQIELAQLLQQRDHPDQAVTLLEGATRSAPTEAPVREALVHAYLATGDFATARTAALDLQVLQPKAAVGFYLAGLASQGQNHLDEAQQSFEQALQIQPQALDSLAALARLKLRRGQGDQAIVLVQNAIAQTQDTLADPSNGFRLNLLGELYLAQKKLAPATDTLTKATALAPNWSVPYRNLAIARYAAQDPSGAITSYQSAIKISPTDSRLVAELAEIYKKQRRPDDAIASYDALLRLKPGEQAIANNLALLLVTYRSDRASLDRARDLTEGFASSNDGVLLDTTGWVRFKRAEYAQALPVLERAVERAPDSKEIRYHLGMAELLSGKKDRARKDLEAALSGSANFVGADEARTTLAQLKNQAS